MSWLLNRTKKEEQVVDNTNNSDSWVIELADDKTTVIGADERTKRKAKIQDFFKLYENDSVTFGLVNFLVQRIVPTYIFEGEDETVKKLNDWAKRVHLKRTLEDMVLDIVLAGNAWVETVWDSVEIEKFKILNPDKMDLIRDGNGDTSFDEEDKPLGYIQDKNGILRYWYKDKIEEGGKTIFKAPKSLDLREKLRYYKLKGYGDSELGVSLIQPGYRDAIIRTNLEDMIGESAFRGGGIIAYIDGELPADVKANLKKDLQSLNSKRIFLLTKKIELKQIPVPEIQDRQQLVYALADLQTGGAGVALELIVSGYSNNKGNFTDKTSDLETRILSYQERLAEQVNDYIIEPLLLKWNLSSTARIAFPPASPVNQLNRARVISSLARRNLMTYDPEVEMQIRRELKLPTNLLTTILDEWKANGNKAPTAVEDIPTNKEEEAPKTEDKDVETKEESVPKTKDKKSKSPELGNDVDVRAKGDNKATALPTS